MFVLHRVLQIVINIIIMKPSYILSLKDIYSKSIYHLKRRYLWPPTLTQWNTLDALT